MSGRKILAGLEEALEHASGVQTSAKERRIQVQPSVDVRNIRRRLALTQQAFAAQFGFSVAAVRHWEQGSRVPETSARLLLTLIDRDPDYVLATLGLQKAATNG